MILGCRRLVLALAGLYSSTASGIPSLLPTSLRHLFSLHRLQPAPAGAPAGAPAPAIASAPPAGVSSFPSVLQLHPQGLQLLSVLQLHRTMLLVQFWTHATSLHLLLGVLDADSLSSGCSSLVRVLLAVCWSSLFPLLGVHTRCLTL